MYRITYDGLTIFDPYGNANEVVSDASMSVEVNASAYLDFTMAMTHPLYDTIRERAGVVTLTWDSTVLFEGVIESVEMDIQGNKSISCVSAMDYLNDTHVRPYSTVAGEADLTAPSSVDGYFQWLIDQHNDHVLDTSKIFDVGINQGANLQQNNFIYRSSESEPTTASEIADQILDSLGGYLTMRYEDGRKVLDLYADLHTMNAQIVDFGVNITDFTKTTDTTDQYTAILLHGGSPTFEGGDLEGGDWSHWETHPNTPLVGDKTHGGSVASYFVSGTGEYINDSFFYSRPGRRYKATVYVKNERGSNVTIRGSYQYEQAGGWTTVNVNSSLAVENKDDQWVEFSFDFQPNLSEYTKIRPRWYFDNVGNDGNRRVYLDDFSFSQIEGDTEVSEDPIGLKQVPDGVSSFDADVFKSGDVLYSTSAVERYGYKEEVFEDTTITNIDDLVQAGIKELNKSKDPQITLDIKAVDLALFMEGYTHLNVGDAVRVRSAIHDTDEFLMVNSITLDLQDPGQSEYVIGKAYDSLTGQQSGFLRSLNSGINSSLDAVASLDQTAKDQAIQIGSVEQVANQAQQTANNAQQTANSNKQSIADIEKQQSEQDKLLEQMQAGVEQAEQEIGGINDRLDQMDTEAGEVQASIDAVRQEAQTNFETAKAAADAAQAKADAVGADLGSFRTETGESIQNVKDSVSGVRSDVDAVTQKAADLASELDGTKATVEQVVTEQGEIKSSVSNAVEKADQSLKVSTQASQTATQAQTTATSAYQDAQSALTQSSIASQTANAVKTELETKYSTTDEIAEQYATKSLVEQTSQSITSTVEATYATKATVEALENIANNAVQTWMGSGVPTLSNKPASDWTTAELKSQHSGDIYYDTDTGYSYRFGSSDGKNYSWSLIKDTDISKAVADAAKAQQTAEGVSDEVTQLKTDIPATYATKTEVKQTTDSIKSSVSEVATTANSALSKATTVEQTAKGLQTTVTEQAEKLDGAVTTISQVSQRVDSVSSTITQVSDGLSSIAANGYNYIPNGAPSGDYNKPSWLDIVDGVYQHVFPGGENHVDLGFQDLTRQLSSDRAYRMSIECRLVSGSVTDSDYVRFGINDKNWQGPACRPKSDWSRFETVVRNLTGDSDSWFLSSFMASSGSKTIQFRNISIVDITDADAATSTANSALSQSSRVEQSLDSFKTSVSRDYQTKTDALSQKSELEQNINSFKTTVSETYTTKDEFNNLKIGSTNLIKNSDFFRQGEEWVFGVEGVTAKYGTDASMGTYVKVLCSSSANRQFYQFTKDVWHKGETLVYSFYAKSDDETPPVIDLSRSLSDYGQKHTLSNTWTRYTGSITSTDTPGGGTLSIRFVNHGVQTALITKIKLERGTKATDWSPAPEDFDGKYTSKTEFKQTTDKISATATSASQNASSALSKVGSLEVSVDGIDTRVEEVASDADEAIKTASQVSQRVDSLSSTITQVQGDIDRIDTNSQNFITNPQFKQGNVDGVANTNMNATDSNPGVLPGTATTFGKNFSGYDNRANNVKIKFIKNHTYRIEIDARLASDNAYTGTEGLGLFFWFMTADNPGLSADQYTSYNDHLIPAGTKEWTHASYDYTPTMGDNDPRIIFRPAYRVVPSSRWLVTNFTCTDVTAIAEAQKDADTANSTANSALSKSSSVEQNLNSFKTSVSQTYETKSDASSKQSSLQQSVNNLRTEVSETYTTKTEFDNLQVGGTNLVKLGGYLFNGNLTNTSYSKGDDLYKFTVPANLSDNAWGYGIYQRGTGHVYAGIPWQSYGILSFYIHADRACEINIDTNTQAFTGSTGATNGGNDHDTLRDHSSYSIPANQWTQVWMRWKNANTNASTGNPNKVDLYDESSIGIKSQSSAINVQIKRIKFEEGTKPTDWSPCPADMLSSDQAAQTYSTKSYVDQTARTVSLGVVEEYKKGQHGSALATQSDITAAKDSITSTVSQTYATKNDVGVGNLITNGDFSDGTSNWATNGGTSKIVDGTYGKQFVFTQTGTNTNGSNRIYNPSYNHVNGQAYEVSFYAKADKSSKWHFGPTGSSKAASATLDTTLKQYTIQYQAEGTNVLSIWTDNPTATIHLERVKLSVASGYYATKTEVKQTSDSLTVTISSAVSKAESAATAASKAQNTANTANTTANTAKNTANTANSNAQNAQNRVGNLETCIKMTSDGVRVGKISNGNLTGYSALVNSAGSFDILDSSTKTLASFNKDGLCINSSSDRGMLVGFHSKSNSGYIGSTPRVVTSEGGEYIDIGMDMDFSPGGYLNIINNLGGIGIAGNGISLIASGRDRVKIGVMDVRGAGVVLFDRDDANNYSVVNITIGYNFSEFNYIMCFFKTNDGQYFGGTAYHPNGKEYNFMTMGGNGTDMSYLKGTRWAFDGTKATRKTTFEIGPGYSTNVNDTVLHIVAIVGFDYYKTSG